MASSFPHARSIIAVYSKGIRDGKPYKNIRYYISSQPPESRSCNRWGELIRGHWGGVENRNHWSRDAIWLEDKTRSRNFNLVGNLAVIRNALLSIVTIPREPREHYGSLPAFTEALRANESEAYRLITTPL